MFQQALQATVPGTFVRAAIYSQQHLVCNALAEGGEICEALAFVQHNPVGKVRVMRKGNHAFVQQPGHPKKAAWSSHQQVSLGHVCPVIEHITIQVHVHTFLPVHIKVGRCDFSFRGAEDVAFCIRQDLPNHVQQ